VHRQISGRTTAEAPKKTTLELANQDTTSQADVQISSSLLQDNRALDSYESTSVREQRKVGFQDPNEGKKLRVRLQSLLPHVAAPLDADAGAIPKAGSYNELATQVQPQTLQQLRFSIAALGLAPILESVAAAPVDIASAGTTRVGPLLPEASQLGKAVAEAYDGPMAPSYIRAVKLEYAAGFLSPKAQKLPSGMPMVSLSGMGSGMTPGSAASGSSASVFDWSEVRTCPSVHTSPLQYGHHVIIMALRCPSTEV
jgi:hypothetical protein